MWPQGTLKKSSWTEDKVNKKNKNKESILEHSDVLVECDQLSVNDCEAAEVPEEQAGK